jgi:hypothetical protein
MQPQTPNHSAKAEAVVSEVNWSHDGQLLAAAIMDYLVIFDIRKLGQPLGIQPNPNPQKQQLLLRNANSGT